MAGFVTETSQMQTAAAHVDDVTAQISSLLSSLRAEVATAPAHFKGSAAATFQQLMTQYDLDAAKLREALTGIAEQIRAAGQTYGSQDTAQSAALRSSGSGLNM
jgi:WXG100 family type VII secretion target